MRYYDYWDNSRLEQYETRIDDFKHKKKTMCGIGIRNVKLLLNRLVKQNERLAAIYRLALELECTNIGAKIYHGDWQDRYYDRKDDLLHQLVAATKGFEGIKYGYQVVGDPDEQYINAIMYFDIPGCRQISFHCHLEYDEFGVIPEYRGTWDGEANSTLSKLEEAICQKYGGYLA